MTEDSEYRLGIENKRIQVSASKSCHSKYQQELPLKENHLPYFLIDDLAEKQTPCMYILYNVVYMNQPLIINQQEAHRP